MVFCLKGFFCALTGGFWILQVSSSPCARLPSREALNSTLPCRSISPQDAGRYLFTSAASMELRCTEVLVFIRVRGRECFEGGALRRVFMRMCIGLFCAAVGISPESSARRGVLRPVCIKLRFASLNLRGACSPGCISMLALLHIILRQVESKNERVSVLISQFCNGRSEKNYLTG